MNREQLAHVLRSAARIVDDGQILVVRFDRPDADPSAAVCLEAHDLVVSKLVAGRDKDLSFAAALIRVGLVDVETLLERAGTLDRPPTVQERVQACVRRLASSGKS